MQPTAEQFTEQAWAAVVAAQQLAQTSRHQQLETEHLLLALLRQNGLAGRILSKTGVDTNNFEASVEAHLQRLPSLGTAPDSVFLGRSLNTALDRAERQRDSATALSPSNTCFWPWRRMIAAAGNCSVVGVTTNTLKEAIKAVRGNQTVTDQNPEGTYESLEKYGRDLTAAARDGKLDPVIGRTRRSGAPSRSSPSHKNNPVLIGEPGVGKTAIVEGLAQRIVNGDVPQALQNRQLIALDMGALIAGAKYRGEERLEAVLKEVTSSDGQLCCSSMRSTPWWGWRQRWCHGCRQSAQTDAGPGELRCIGATTLDEHRQHIEKDPALERRFQQVLVDQPTVADTISILRGLKERYEVHHGVRIADSALVAAAMLSSRYITDRFLPDKAIDLVDESAARLKMEITSKPEQIDEIDRKILQLEMEKLSLGRESDTASQERLLRIERELAELGEQQRALNAQWQEERGAIDELSSLKEEIERVQLQVEQAKRNYDLNKAAELEYGTLATLQRQLQTKESELADDDDSAKTLLREEVTEDDIAEVIAKWTGIPVARLVQSEMEKLLQLEDDLHRRVIGQPGGHRRGRRHPTLKGRTR